MLHPPQSEKMQNIVLYGGLHYNTRIISYALYAILYIYNKNLRYT